MTDLLGRLEDKFLVDDGCWEWIAARSGGYGKLGNRYAHRVMYELMIGPIPAGMVIDHLCRNKGCVRPDHLEAVVQACNVQRGLAGTVRNPSAAKTHCPQGHPYDEANTCVCRGKRHCRACNRTRSLAAYHRKKRS